jgi:hypothetical protein
MEPSTQNARRTIDVTGLPEEAVHAVESLVSQLRGEFPRFGGAITFASHEAWSRALHEWIESHPRRGTLADDSRESIYADRDE